MSTPLKVCYYTAGPIATSAEIAAINTLKALGDAPYEVTVMSGASQAQVTAITISATNAGNYYTDAGATITASTISADSSDNSLNDSGSGFITAGFQANDLLTISGFTGDTSNNTDGVAVVASVAAGKMVLKGVTLVSDSAGESVTVTSAGRFLRAGFKVGKDVMVRGFTTAGNNISTGIITALTPSRMTIGGTDGDGIANESAGNTVTICTVATDAKYGTSTPVYDYIAGTIPEQFKSGGTPIYTELDPTNPPDDADLISTQAVISNGETVAVKTNGGSSSDNATATVVAHALTVALPATKTVVENSDTTTVDGATVTLAVSGGAVTGGTLTGTKCVVSSGDTVAVGSDDVTITVAGNAMTTASIGATKTIVENGDTTTISGKSIALAVGTGALGVATFAAATDAAISNGATVAVGTGTATLTVAGNALASAALDATHVVVADAQEITITAGGGGLTKVTLTVAGGAITACVAS